MNKFDRTKRIHHLHDLILQQSVTAKQQVANRLQEETYKLNHLHTTIHSLDQVRFDDTKSAFDAVLWQHYFDALHTQENDQSATVDLWQAEMEKKQELTVIAYQDARRWEIYRDKTKLAYETQDRKKDLRDADDLASSRHRHRD